MVVLVKLTYPVDMPLPDGAAYIIDTPHLVGVVRNVANGYLLIRTNDETTTFMFCLSHKL